MVKSVVGEESRLKLAEDRLSQSSIPAQVYSLSLSLFEFLCNLGVFFFHNSGGLSSGRACDWKT